MSFELITGLKGVAGDIAVKPSKVVLVLKSSSGCELQLEGGSFIPLLTDPEWTAKRLWGFATASDNGFFNTDHVLAVTPHPNGSRIHLTNNVTLDTPMPAELLVESLERLDKLRDDIRMLAPKEEA